MSDKILSGMPLPGLGAIPHSVAAVDILEKVLAEARAGRVVSIAMVMIDPQGGVATPWAGPQIPQMYLGAGMLQARIIRGIESPAARSAIIPARQAGG